MSFNNRSRYFGTDGMRGKANVFPMTASVAYRAALATVQTVRMHTPTIPYKRVLIGKDTRLSGYLLESALTSGFIAMGMDVMLSGPIPTPAVAQLTRSMRADIGVMISASHNPFDDNGIKFFDRDGYKFSDSLEEQISQRIEASDLEHSLAASGDLGKATRLDDAGGRTIEYLKSTLPRGLAFRGLHLVIDCAHGAAYKIAPRLFWELEARVTSIGTDPNGRNINAGCGATAPAHLAQTVRAEQADLGIAFDGDADRVIMVDGEGQVIDGDQILALLARFMHENGTLKGTQIIGTVMANLGLERFLNERTLHLERTAVGDRYVMEKMRETGANLGGEQAGHIILSDLATTGDGMLTALHVIAALVQSGQNPRTFLRAFTPVPQMLRNIRVADKAALEDSGVQAVINAAANDLKGNGRLLVRPSGTEPLIRVMAEGDDPVRIEKAVNHICSALEKVSV